MSSLRRLTRSGSRVRLGCLANHAPGGSRRSACWRADSASSVRSTSMSHGRPGTDLAPRAAASQARHADYQLGIGSWIGSSIQWKRPFSFPSMTRNTNAAAFSGGSPPFPSTHSTHSW
jgi:hypothetical protein